jgi:hypothetical protein
MAVKKKEAGKEAERERGKVPNRLLRKYPNKRETPIEMIRLQGYRNLQ